MEAALLLPGPSLGDLVKSCTHTHPGLWISHLYKRHIGLAQNLASVVRNRPYNKYFGFCGPHSSFELGINFCSQELGVLEVAPVQDGCYSKMVARAWLLFSILQ